MLSSLFANWPLRRQIIVVLGFTIMAVGIFSGEFVRKIETQAFEKNFTYQTQKLVAMLSATSIDAIVSEDRPVLKTIIRQLVDNDKDVYSVEIENAYDEVLTSWTNENSTAETSVLRHYAHDILLDGESFGQIRVAWDVRHQYAEIHEHVMKIRIFAFSIFAALTVIVVMILTSLVITPIRNIHSHLSKLQSNEKVNSLEVVASRELINLGDTVNELGNILELRKQKEIELKEASKAKSEFLANMSHELRTPMNGVLGMLNIVKQTELNPEQKEAVKIAMSSGKSLLTLINDILDFSKIEAGRLEFETIEFDLETMAEEVTEVLAEQAHSKKIELICNIGQDVPSMVEGDPTRIRQVLTNLLGNAVKFTDEGEVLVQIEKINDSSSCNKLKFSVTDSGVGIAEEALSKVFESFAQADGSTTRQYGGTGLGLAISKQLIEGMQGQFGAISELGKGSVFWFELDLKPVAETSQDNSYSALANTKVLLIDTNISNRTKIEKLFSTHNIESVSHDSGKMCLDILRQADNDGVPFNLVLFNSTLADMPAEVFAGCIEADPAYDNVRLVPMTNVIDQVADLYPHNNKRISAQLTKPIRSKELLKTIGTTLNLTHITEDSQHIESKNLQEVFSKINILVVEDNLVNQEVAIGMLEMMGFNVDVADNGQEGLDILTSEKTKFDLILMDCQMPVLDGYETTGCIRELDEPLKSIPVIALTANAMTGDSEKCLSAGMNDYLSKPFEVESLEEKIKYWLKDKISSLESEMDTDDEQTIDKAA